MQRLNEELAEPRAGHAKQVLALVAPSDQPISAEVVAEMLHARGVTEESERTFLLDVLETLLSSLRREVGAQPQHHLLVGARGMGKTTLLHRLAYAIEDDAVLRESCLGVVFPEEQYNVGDLADFWLNCVDALADQLDALPPDRWPKDIDADVEQIMAILEREDRRRAALDLLCRLATQIGRRLVLLVDNLDLVLDRLSPEEEWSLRETLSSEPRLQVIGASSVSVESTYEHDKAFFDFFRVRHLDALSDEETLAVLTKLAEAEARSEIVHIVRHDPGRIKTIRLMAGGNPRTVALLFQVLAQTTDGDVRSDLDRLLDQCTPLYKHRLEVLPAGAQRTITALAAHWHPATANEIARATHTSVNATSVQLGRLVKDGLVEKVELPGTRRTGFQLAERFFNVWCLMRSSRRLRQRLLWLVEFIRMMFGRHELDARAHRYLDTPGAKQDLRRAELGLALAGAVDDGGLKGALETEALRSLLADPANREAVGDLLDLDGADASLVGKVERLRLLAEAKEDVLATGASEDVWLQIGGSFVGTVQQKRALSRMYRERPDERERALTLMMMPDEFLSGFLPSELASLRRAVAQGDLDLTPLTNEDVDAATRQSGMRPAAACGLAIAVVRGLDVDIDRFTDVVSDSGSLSTRIEWGRIATQSGLPRAEILPRLLECRDAREWAAAPLGDLARLLRFRLYVHQEALDTARRATQAQGADANAWRLLGGLLVEEGAASEALTVLEVAVGLAPDSRRVWGSLGDARLSAGDYEGAERAFDRVLELDPDSGWGNFGRGRVFESQGRLEEAEREYRRAIAAQPDQIASRLLLATLLDDRDERRKDAEKARLDLIEILRREMASTPDARTAHTLALTLSEIGETDQAIVEFGHLLELERYNLRRLFDVGAELVELAELRDDPPQAETVRLATIAYTRILEVDPDSVDALRELAWLRYACGDTDDETLALARRAVALVPEDGDAAHTLATILVARGEWPEASRVARRFIESTNEEEVQDFESTLLHFFEEAVRRGLAEQARDLLIEAGKAEPWQPLVHALEIVAADDRTSLKGLAPEMREAVELVLEWLEDAA